MIEISTPALLFPAISLLLLAYTNRFLALANVVRNLAPRLASKDDESARKQVHNLRIRIHLIRWMQTFGVLSFFFCVVSMTFLFCENDFGGSTAFGASLILLMVSLALSLLEAAKSGEALEIELLAYDLRRKQDD